jgi:hypothetical protein
LNPLPPPLAANGASKANPQNIPMLNFGNLKWRMGQEIMSNSTLRKAVRFTKH